MKHLLIALPTLLLASLAVLHAAEPKSSKAEAGSKAETDQKLQWSFTPNPSLPNVLILGDSISIGYTLGVRKQLEGAANVFRPMDGNGPLNCTGTTFGAQQIDRLLAGHKWTVIHFNWGLHDLKHVTAPGIGQNSNKPEDPLQATVEEYSRNMEKIVAKLKATGARLVFATTTPVAPGTVNPLREPESPSRYNAAALKIMQANGIRVNDLFAFCEPQLAKWQLPKNVHFTPVGSEALAHQVAAVIKEELDAADKDNTKSDPKAH